MNSRFSAKRLIAAAQATVLAALMTLPSTAFAAENDVTLELRPHCDKNDDELENVFGGPIGGDIPGITTPTDGSHCSQYLIADPLHRETPLYKNGEEIDMDLVILNPGRKDVSRVRGWIAYDPTILEGVSIELLPAFSVPTPGEADFDAENGVMKIGASATRAQDEKVIKVARIKVRVISTPTNKTILSHDDVSGGIDSRSAVVSGEAGQEANILAPSLGSLIVRLDAPEAASSASSAAASSENDEGETSSAAQESSQTSEAESETSASSSSSAATEVGMESSSSSLYTAAPSETNTTFTLLQVQNLRATTEGTAVFLAWDPLPSKEITGYNVYYGTTSGKYIQRRSIDSSTTTLTVRGLMEGTTYFFAVRGVNGKSQETQFSKEVAVRVGYPETSTNPLAASAVTDKGPGGTPPRTGGTIAGDSGTSSVYILFFAACGVIGTLMAFRRQFVATAPAHA